MEIKHPFRVRLVTGILMGSFMAFFMSAFVTWINTGYDAEFIDRWMKAFSLAVTAAIPLAVLIGHRARQLAERLVG